MILLVGVACQEEKVQKNEEPKDEMKEVKMAALNVCGDTENADILLLCDDGSYILCEAENSEGYSVVYMNESLENKFENGLSVFLDENGTPIMATSSKGTFVFKNVSYDSFDCAFIDNQNEISYYNNIQFDFQSMQSRSSLTTRSIFDPWIDSWRTLTSSGWDEHNKKAIVPFLCKIASFAITAGDAVWGTGQIGLAQTFLSELYKSGYYKNEWLDDLFFGTGMTSLSLSGIDLKNFLNNGNVVFTPKKFGLSYLAYLLNEYGDNQLEKLGQIEEWVGPHFDTEEWRISLSTNLLECYPDDDWYLVDVSSKAMWDIDESQIDHNWCEVKKLDVQVAVHVKPNEGENDRTCNLVIYAKNSTEIAPVSLTIKQSGIVFELSEEKLSFTQDGGSKGVYITTNENIKSWDVTSYPSWCKIEKGNYSFFINVFKNDGEKREGIITVTAYRNGGILNKEILIEQESITNAFVGTWLLEKEQHNYIYQRSYTLKSNGSGICDQDYQDILRWSNNGNKIHIEVDCTVDFTNGTIYLGQICFKNFFIYDGTLNSNGNLIEGTVIGHTGFGWNDGKGSTGEEYTCGFTLTRKNVP